MHHILKIKQAYKNCDIETIFVLLVVTEDYYEINPKMELNARCIKILSHNFNPLAIVRK